MRVACVAMDTLIAQQRCWSLSLVTRYFRDEVTPLENVWLLQVHFSSYSVNSTKTGCDLMVSNLSCLVKNWLRRRLYAIVKDRVGRGRRRVSQGLKHCSPLVLNAKAEALSYLEADKTATPVVKLI